MLSIAHRDIKPQNILVDKHENTLVISDFGSAKQLVKSTIVTIQIKLTLHISALGAIEHQN